MTNEKSIEVLYKIIKAKLGRNQAKATVRALLSNILDDLEDEGLEVTEKNIADRLQEKVKDFADATKTEVA